MTTFGYAYHSDSAEILKGRAAFKEINRIMRGLDGKAFETANTMLRKEYAQTQTSNPFIGGLFGPPYQPYSAFSIQAQQEAFARQRELALVAQQNAGLLGPFFRGFL